VPQNAGNIANTYPEDLFERPENYRDAIVFGSMFDQSTDLPNLKAAVLALKEANGDDLDAIEGRPVVMVSCTYEENLDLDTLDYDEAAVEVSTWLADVMGARAILGPGTSDQSIAAYNAVSSKDVLIIAPSATSPALITIDGEQSTEQDPGLFWRPAPPDSAQAFAMASDILRSGTTDIRAVFQDTAYGGALADLFKDELDNAGYTGAFAREPFTDDVTRNYATAQAFVGEGDPAVVVFISSDVLDIVSFLDAIATSLDHSNKDLFLTDSASDPDLQDGRIGGGGGGEEVLV